MHSILLSLSLIFYGIILYFLLQLTNVSIMIFFCMNIPLTNKYLCNLTSVVNKYSMLCDSIEEKLIKLI
jgi:hypothetical protein